MSENINAVGNPELKFKVSSIVLDSNDSEGLSEFYAKMLGWNKRIINQEWISVSLPDTRPILLFQTVSDYERPVWPEKPGKQQQMVHMDYAVNDLEAAISHAVSCGAKMAEEQFSDHWRVLFDPAGHPFCLMQRNI